MLCTRRTSWAHACCTSLPLSAAGRSLCTLTSPSSEPPATLVSHLHVNACGTVMQLINQLPALMAWRTCLSSVSDRWLERLPAWMTEGVFSRCTLAKSGVLVAHQRCLSGLAPAPCMTQMSETPRRASEQEMWFGQLRLLFAFTRGPQEYNAAFIRWYPKS